MTDGCGFLNRAAAAKISAKLKYERLPVAYQGSSCIYSIDRLVGLLWSQDALQDRKVQYSFLVWASAITPSPRLVGVASHRRFSGTADMD
jgi:hypothetical protein